MISIGKLFFAVAPFLNNSEKLGVSTLSGIVSTRMCAFQPRLGMANLYLIKCLGIFEPVMMADGKISRDLSSICRNANRLLRETVAKFRSLTPCFFKNSSWYFGQMPVIGVSVKNNCERCREKVVLRHRFSHCLNER